MHPDRRSRLNWALAFTLGALLRALFLLHYPRLTTDGTLYADLATNLLTHHLYGFTVPDALPRATLIRLPGYPLFLAACFRLFGLANFTAVLWVQLAVDLVTCGLLASLAGRLFGPRAGRYALWLSALCPFTANYVATALTETLTLATIALAFFALERWTSGLGQGGVRPANVWLVSLGCALAYSLLLRPEQGLLAAAVVPAVLWVAACHHRSLPRALIPALLVAALTLAPLAPWAVRNWRVFHVVQPLAPRYANDPDETNPIGFERWFRTWASGFSATDEVYWNYSSAPIDPAALPPLAFDSPAQQRSTLALIADYNQTTSASDALDRRFAALASERIAAHPLRFYVLLPAARLADMLFRPRVDLLPFETRWFAPRTHPTATAFAFAYALLNLAYFALATWTASVLLRRPPRRSTPPGCSPWLQPIAYAMLATIALRAALLLTVDNSEPRYTLEFYPVLIPFAAVALARLFSPHISTESPACPTPANGLP